MEKITLGKIIGAQVRNQLGEGRATDEANTPLLIESFFSERVSGTLVLQSKAGPAIHINRKANGDLSIEICDS